MPFTLSYHRSHRMPHFVQDRQESLDRTVTAWREWTKRCRFACEDDRWSEAVVRSLITLRLLTFLPTGGIVAAPTTSLPEKLGGRRNWDYRYCWIRDSTLTLYALLNAGYREEAESCELDAALLLIPQTGFLPPDDPRIAGTIAAIEQELKRGPFVMRYTKDVVDPTREGAFLACSFWLADAYVLLGRLDDATALFEQLLDVCNDVGLLSEEYDVDARRLIGNFPQGFSHIGLINTAFNLVKARGPALQRSGGAPPVDAAHAND